MVNPPPLAWVHDKENLGYSVQWSARPDFVGATTVDNLRWCADTHDRPLSAWSVPR